MIRVFVDDKQIQVEGEANLLHACLENGIYIPHLCSLKNIDSHPASCRLCFVEIEGKSRPVCSCKVVVKEGMVVRTDTEPVRRLQRTSLRLLLSVHKAECRKCPSNRKCELQRMVRLLGVRLRPRRFEHIDRDDVQMPEHPCLSFIPSRCVLCEKCISVCKERKHGKPLLTFANRGFHTVVTALGGEAEEIACRDCHACVDICPVSAILMKE